MESTNKKKKFDKQLDKTSKIHEDYTKAKEALKELFYDMYDEATIYSLLEIINILGHPAEKKFANKFETNYKNGNFDDVEIKQLKVLIARYQEPLIKKLNGEEWN